jgi:hypothetical protein
VYITVYLSREREQKKSFVSQWRSVLNSDKVHTVDRHHLFSKHTWEYILAYIILDKSEETGSAEGVED